MKLNVYGRMVEVLQSGDGWLVFYLGNDGKKRRAGDIVIPIEIKEDEVVQYISDLCHEWATPSLSEVKILQ